METCDHHLKHNFCNSVGIMCHRTAISLLCRLVLAQQGAANNTGPRPDPENYSHEAGERNFQLKRSCWIPRFQKYLTGFSVQFPKHLLKHQFSLQHSQIRLKMCSFPLTFNISLSKSKYVNSNISRLHFKQ